MPQGKGTYGHKVGRPPGKEKSPKGWKEKYGESKVGPGPEESPTLRDSMIDDMAFNALPKDPGAALYTESMYNTQLTPEEKGSYDRKSSRLLKQMYKDDKAKGLFGERITFENYQTLISDTFVNERTQFPRDDDPAFYEEMGDLLNNVYEGDFQQMIDSASKWSPDQDKDYEKKSKTSNIKQADYRP